MNKKEKKQDYFKIQGKYIDQAFIILICVIIASIIIAVSFL